MGHFSKYGEVKDVHVSRRENNTRGVYTRPSNLAFVVMVSSEGALTILRQAEHDVLAPDGVVHKILAEAFQQNHSESEKRVLQERADEENHAKQSGGPAQKQQKREHSTDGKDCRVVVDESSNIAKVVCPPRWTQTGKISL